jgi:hypothetical protein
MTRGRKGSKLYADDLELVEENVSRRRERPMATEMLQGNAEAFRDVEIVEETAKGNEMSISESLGKAEAGELAVEAQAELERVMAAEPEREIEREEEMVMEM